MIVKDEEYIFNEFENSYRSSLVFFKKVRRWVISEKGFKLPGEIF